MTTIIDEGDVANWLDRPDLQSSSRLELIVEMVNGLIDEKWTLTPRPTQTPTSVRLLALTMASRALASTPGQPPLQSVTRAVDDSSRTERYAISDAVAAGYGVYITDAELTALNSSGSGAYGGSLKLVTSLTKPLT